MRQIALVVSILLLTSSCGAEPDEALEARIAELEDANAELASASSVNDPVVETSTTAIAATTTSAESGPRQGGISALGDPIATELFSLTVDEVRWARDGETGVTDSRRPDGPFETIVVILTGTLTDGEALRVRDVGIRYSGSDFVLYESGRSGCYVEFDSGLPSDDNKLLVGGTATTTLCIVVPEDAMGTGSIEIEDYRSAQDRWIEVEAPILSTPPER